MAMLFLINGVVVGSWLPRLPEIRDRLGIGLGTLGLTLALGGLGSLLGSSLSGKVVGRNGSRRTAVVAGGIVYLFLPLIAVVPTAPLLAAVLAIMGFIDSQADVGMNAVAVRVEQAAGRSIMTRLHGLWSLGGLIGSGVSALAVLGGIGLGPQLIVLSVLGIGIAFAAGRLIPDAPPRPASGRRSGRLALGLVLAGATAVFLEGTPLDWSAVFLTDFTGSGAALAGTGVILFTLGMLGGRMGGDWVVDRFGSMPVLYAGILTSVLAGLLAAAVRDPVPALAAFLVWGLGISVALPILYKLAGSHPSFSEGSGLAALTFGTRIGFMAAPGLIGLAATAWTLPRALAFVVGLAGMATILAVRLALTSHEPLGDSIPGRGVS